MKSYAKNIAYIAINVALLSISAFFTLPLFIPFTLQVLFLSLICGLFNFKTSFLSVLIYIILGIIGLPIFSGFKNGITTLISPTGGFLIGFLFFPLCHLFFYKNKNQLLKLILSNLVSLILLYILGITWCSIFIKTTLNLKSIFILLLIDLLKCLISIKISLILSKTKLFNKQKIAD